jgi:protein O-mannosyl-transferase
MPESKPNFFQANREVIVIAVLSILVFAIYWQATGFSFINLDDSQYIYENPAVMSGLNWESVRWAFKAFHSANWHPLTWLSHMLDVQLFGANAGGHHAVNVMLHVVNSILAFAVFRKLTGSFWRSAIVAALFAVHPAHVESVAWVAERKDVLSTLFWLLTMWAYVRYAKRETDAEGDLFTRITSLPYLLVIGLFALGLMAKPMLVTLPFVLVLLDVWPLGRIKSLRDVPAMLTEKIPMFVLSAASSYVTVIAQRSAGAVESLDYLPIDVRLLNSVVSYAKYVVMLFYPVDLGLMYLYVRDFPAWQIGGAILLLIGITAICVQQFRARKYLLVGWLWFVGTLVPVIGIVQVGSQPLADRYTYVPYFGLFIMLVWGVADVLDHFKVSRTGLVTGFGVAVIVLSVMSFRQTSSWRENETVYARALAANPNNYIVMHDLCYTYTLAARNDEAEPLCRRVIEIKPDFYRVYNTLGILQIGRRQYAEAEQSFAKVLEFMPNFSLANANMSLALALQKRPEDAEQTLEKAVKFDNGSVKPEVWINALNALAMAYAEKGNHEKAAENLTRMLALDNANVDARGNLSLMLFHMGRLDEAQQLAESALQINPNLPIPYNTYGLILLAQDRKLEAAGMFEKALKLKPDFAEAQANLKRAQK